jgi:hypothetical protein
MVSLTLAWTGEVVMTDEQPPKENLNPGWHYVPEYWPAIYLALNHAAGGLEIFDVIYYEENDMFYVELEERGYYDMGYALPGPFVRNCFHAVKKGITSWTKTPTKEQ